MSMKVPLCLYQKAFWFTIPLLIALVSLIYGTIEASIAQLEVKVDKNIVQIAQNNVPTLKEDLKTIDTKIDTLLINQARLEQKIDDNINK